MGVWYWIEQFLVDPKWGGVQGVVAILALIAAVIAAIDLIIRASRDNIQAMTFMTKKTRVNDRTDLEISVRPMGTTKLIEAEWLTVGTVALEQDEFPSLMTVKDAPVSISLTVPTAELQDVYVAVTHLVPARFGSRKLAARLRLSDLSYQWWEPYRWYWWPRSTHGRWKSNKTRKRSLLHDPTF